ncbi:MAG: hypothetical protein IH827_06055, partial [Myxococcales bacterium]|nr:hypothetical protein [Myxococcales bacterium]
MSAPNETGPDELALEELPEIPEENLEAWEKIEATQIQPRMKRALHRLACGESFRKASESEGYKSFANLFRYAQKHGLISMTDKALINQFRRTTCKSLDEIEHRITEDPDSMSVKDLAVIAGIGAGLVWLALAIDRDQFREFQQAGWGGALIVGMALLTLLSMVGVLFSH